MVVEYFTKWVEAKPVTNITSVTIKNSCGKTSSVATKFYSRSQLTTISTLTAFKDFYHQVRMKVAFVSIYHP
jgi:hypothetical protein